MNKNNTKLTISQEKKSLNWSGNSVVIVKETVEGLTFGARRLLNLLIANNNNLKIDFHSIKWFSSQLTYTKRHIYRLLNELEEANIIKRNTTKGLKKRKCAHMLYATKTNIYVLNKSFYAFKVRQALISLLSAAKFMPFFLFLFVSSQTQAFHQQRATRLENEYKRQSNFQNNIVTLRYVKSKDLNCINSSTLRLLRKPTQGESVANEISKKNEIKFRPCVEQCQQYVNLTPHGKAKLSVFADSALQVGCREVQKLINKTEQEKFAYLYKVAHNETKRLNLVPDWDVYKIYKNSLTILSSDPVVYSNPAKLRPPQSQPLKRPTTGPLSLYRPEKPTPSATDQELSALKRNSAFRANCLAFGLDPDSLFNKNSPQPPSNQHQVVRSRTKRVISRVTNVWE